MLEFNSSFMPFPQSKILLVEDDPTNELVLRAILHKLGYQVDVATTGKQALTQVIRLNYDLILMDCWLPDIDGWQVTQLLRQYEQEHRRHTVVIALTALVTEYDRDKCFEAGMDGYLSKPVKLKDLSKTLEYWLNPIPALLC
jgi:CheY-like chemotaxis protein